MERYTVLLSDFGFSSCCGESEVAWVRSRDASDGDDSGVGHSSSRFLKAAKQ